MEQLLDEYRRARPGRHVAAAASMRGAESPHRFLTFQPQAAIPPLGALPALAPALAVAYRLVVDLLRIVWIACWTFGLAAAALPVWSTVATTSGGPAFSSLLALTRQGTLPLALTLVAGAAFAASALAALVLVGAWTVLRHRLLRDTVPANGTVESSRETWLSVERRPVMLVRVVVATPAGSVSTSTRQPFATGSAPRRGDSVALALSRSDPGCCRIVGVA